MPSDFVEPFFFFFLLSFDMSVLDFLAHESSLCLLILCDHFFPKFIYFYFVLLCFILRKLHKTLISFCVF
jgi:hypothetical protein